MGVRCWAGSTLQLPCPLAPIVAFQQNESTKRCSPHGGAGVAASLLLEEAAHVAGVLDLQEKSSGQGGEVLGSMLCCNPCRQHAAWPSYH